MAASTIPTETDQIREWRSIVTLIVFCITNIIIILPFHIPVYLPRWFVQGIKRSLVALRILSPPKMTFASPWANDNDHNNGKDKPWVRFRFPLNFVTAPLIADLFLLAITAIGRKEVHDGTVGANHISPIDIMAFFLTLAYVAISIDASGLIRYFAFKVLQWGGKVGHRLFFFLYTFFFLIAAFIGNDPIILSGTAFLAYMTRVSSNIVHPRAWIFTQFSVANIASAILVSSNPTNLVLAGAFKIRFIVYTANMIVPVIVTAIVLFPFLMYILFADQALIPASIKMHELPDESRQKTPVNPNIPFAKEEEGVPVNEEEDKIKSLEEIMNPFLDKHGAMFAALIMTVALVTIVVLNATTAGNSEPHPVFWITCPAAFVTFVWDLSWGWIRRKETREIAKKRRMDALEARETRRQSMFPEYRTAIERNADVNDTSGFENEDVDGGIQPIRPDDIKLNEKSSDALAESSDEGPSGEKILSRTPTTPALFISHSDNDVDNRFAQTDKKIVDGGNVQIDSTAIDMTSSPVSKQKSEAAERAAKKVVISDKAPPHPKDIEAALEAERGPASLQSFAKKAFQWTQDTFPTAVAVASHLPFALVPFGLTNFVLVQGLVTKGWVAVFAYGWNHWVNKTGTVGVVGGMGFISVVLCNFAGTNIGATILLSRVIQTWVQIHKYNGEPISERDFWATVYGMALGVNYGAFSAVFSASLAGLLWRDILSRKHIHIGRLEFARVNFPIIAISMCIGCAILVGQVYLTRNTNPMKLDTIGD